jgi:hypothetical protein
VLCDKCVYVCMCVCLCVSRPDVLVCIEDCSPVLVIRLIIIVLLVCEFVRVHACTAAFLNAVEEQL